jgi:hypothetical protein
MGEEEAEATDRATKSGFSATMARRAAENDGGAVDGRPSPGGYAAEPRGGHAPYDEAQKYYPDSPRGPQSSLTPDEWFKFIVLIGAMVSCAGFIIFGVIGILAMLSSFSAGRGEAFMLFLIIAGACLILAGNSILFVERLQRFHTIRRARARKFLISLDSD